MRKRIPVEELAVGMRIVRLDRSWLETPFFRHRMRVTDKNQIETLKACGIRFVDVEVEDSYEAAVVDRPEEAMPADVQEPAAALGATPSAVPEPPFSTSFEEELPAARQVYRAAKQIIEGAMHDVRMGREINMDAVNHVVSEMADSVLRNPDALTSLSRLKKFDEYTFYHSVNTAVLALALGRRLGCDRTTLHRLGVGALLHDIGKTKIPLEILNKPGKLESHEFELMKQHVMRGVEILSFTTGLDDTCLRPALEHHERVDGTGYPYQRKKKDLSQFGMIAAVVDIYDAITSDRCYHKAKPLHEALRFLYRLGQCGHLHGELVQRFIQVVGVYPVGSCVALNTGEIAVVSKINHHEPLKPVVLVLTDSSGSALPKPESLDLATQMRKPVRAIEKVLDPRVAGVNPNDVLDGGGS